MPNIGQKPHMHTYKYGLSFIISFMIIVAGCTLPNSSQQSSRIKFSIQNTLPIERNNVPIVLTIDQLRNVSPDITLKALAVVTGQERRETMIPAQADDISYDGERDQLVFLIDLAAEEKKEISILYEPNVKATVTLDVNKLTRAGIFPKLNAVAALESDLLAYVLKPNGAVVAYGKKREHLFTVDRMFQNELNNNAPFSPEFRLHFETYNINLTQNPQALIIDIEKPEHRWVIRDFENQEDFYVRKSDEQLNIYKSTGLSLNALLPKQDDPNINNVEDTTMVLLTPHVDSIEGLIGCGGFALWHKTEQRLIPIPQEGDYVRVLANGALRSIVQRILPNWKVGGDTFQLTYTTHIYGNNPWLEHYIHIDGQLPSDYTIVAGIPKLKETFGIDEDKGLLWSWGTDPDETDPLGIALIYPTSQTSGPVDTDPSLMTITLHPDDEGRLGYRSLAIWDGGINGIETQAEFKQHLQKMLTTMENVPRITFIPLAQ